MSGKKKLVDEVISLARKELGAPETRTIKGAELLKKTEGLTEDPFGFSKFAKPLNEMEYKVEMLPREEYKTIDPYDLVKQNATIAGHISDRTAAGRKVTNIGGVDLTEPLTQRGGVDFQRTTPYAWANRPGAGKGLNKKLNEAAKSGDPVYTTPVFMGASSANSSHMVGVPLIRMIPHLPISKADKLAFDAMMSERFPGWPGIDKTKEAEAFMYSGKVPGSAISRFIDYASAKKWRGAGFPDTSEIMFSSMDPRLVGVTQGSTGMGFKQFDPGKEVIIKGENAHPDYPAAIPGKEYAGGFKYQTPQSIMFPDWWNSLKPELRDPKNATKAQHTLMTQVPTQKATPEWADTVLEHWEKNPVKWGYADGGEVDDDVNDALRVAKEVGGGTTPQVFMTDAQGRQYDVNGKPIQPATAPEQSNATAQPQQQPENINKMFNAAPQNYETEVQPLIDYAMTPIDRPGMSSEPDLVQAMKVATELAAEGQQANADTRGTGNLARRREELVNSIYGANPERPNDPSSNQAWIANRMIDFSPWALAEVAHDIPYEAVRTGDYGTAAVEGGINAALTAPVMGLAGRGIKKGYEAVKRNSYLTAGAAGAIGLTADPAQAEAGPARWFSKAMEVAQAIPMEKMTGEQALAMLRKSVSPEELKWTGTEKFLSSTPRVTKGELLEHLKNNRMQINQVTLGGDKPTSLGDIFVRDIPPEIRDKYMPKIGSMMEEKARLGIELKNMQGVDTGAMTYDQYHDHGKKIAGILQRSNELTAQITKDGNTMRQEYADSIGGLSKPTKYQDYSTAGGKGYSENLYTYNTKKPPRVEKRDGLWSLIGEDGNVLRTGDGKPYVYWSEDSANTAAKSLYRTSGDYQSSHWDDPNVLFHTRSQTLTYDPPGSSRPFRVHNVDETQSDWGQAARKHGMREPGVDIRKIFHEKVKKNTEDWIDEKAKVAFDAQPAFYDGDINKARALARQMATINGAAKIAQDLGRHEEYLDLYNKVMDATNAVVAGPFVGSTEGWTDRAIKQELDRALDNGSDYFSWSPGEVHADRYDLSRHIGRVKYDPYLERFTAHDPSGRHIVSDDVSDPQKIDEYVGKELGDKIRAMSDKRKAEFYDGISIENNPETGGWDIMRGGKPIVLYGQDAVGFPAKSDAAEFIDGAFGDSLKVDPIQIEGLDLKTGGEGMKGYYDKVYLKRVQDVIKRATGEKPNIEVIEVQTADGPRKQLGIRLTDEMREKARFSDFNRGGTVTGSHSYGNKDDVVNTALALTREY